MVSITVIILCKYKKLNHGINFYCCGNGLVKYKIFLLTHKMGLTKNINLVYNKEK
jgi:hypothetical protein